MTPKARMLLLSIAVATAAGGALADQPPERLVQGVERLDARDAYRAHCGQCHGPNGQGGIGIAVDFTAPESAATLDRERMLHAVLNGHDAETREHWAALDRSGVERVVDYAHEAFVLPAPVSDAGIGRRIYARTCSVCHGERGDGASWAKNSLDPPPRDFTGPESLRLTRREMVNAVTYGVDGTAMMPFATQFSREDIAAVVDFIRNDVMGLPAGADTARGDAAGVHDHAAHAGDLAASFDGGVVGHAAPGRALYESNCVQCHGLEGDGRGPRAAFMRRAPRDFTSPGARAELNRPHLFDGIAHGVVGTEMPAWSTVLDDQQIADVAEYVFTTFVAAGTGGDSGHGGTEAGHDGHGHEHKRRTGGNKRSERVEANAPPGDGDCAAAEDELLLRGRRVYDARCYFCHGYSGDAATVAAAFLTPPPRAFTTATDLGPARLRSAIADGRPGTAMQGFTGLLDPDDIEAVARFIERRFIACGAPRPGYHTVENGWPDHSRRYAAAYPIVLGAAPMTAPAAEADAAWPEGWRLYREACIICHDIAAGRSAMGAGANPVATTADHGHDGRHAAHHGEPHDYGAYGGEDDVRNDRPPWIANPTPRQALGERLYQESCAQCHATDGTGRNWIGRFLEPHPPDLTAGDFWTGRSDTDLAEAIIEGVSGTSMPTFGAVMSDDEAGAIVAYMRRAFAPRQGVPP